MLALPHAGETFSWLRSFEYEGVLTHLHKPLSEIDAAVPGTTAANHQATVEAVALLSDLTMLHNKCTDALFHVKPEHSNDCYRIALVSTMYCEKYSVRGTLVRTDLPFSHPIQPLQPCSKCTRKKCSVSSCVFSGSRYTCSSRTADETRAVRSNLPLRLVPARLCHGSHQDRGKYVELHSMR
jgi:hypothetical protein